MSTADNDISAEGRVINPFWIEALDKRVISLHNHMFEPKMAPKADKMAVATIFTISSQLFFVSILNNFKLQKFYYPFLCRISADFYICLYSEQTKADDKRHKMNYLKTIICSL